MFTLRIYVVGLVALVPHLFGDNSLAAYLPNVAVSGEEHVPVVIFPCSDRQRCAFNAQSIANDLKLSLYSGLLGSGTHYGGFRLAGERVSVSPAVPADFLHELELAGGKVSRPSDVTGALPESSMEAKAFDWIPRLGGISSDHEHLRKDLLKPKGGPVVAAIFELRNVQGTVSVFRMAEMKGMVPAIKFEVTSMGQSLTVLRQAVPEVVQIDVEMQGTSACLKATRFSDLTARWVSLSSTQGGVVEILVGNLQVPSNIASPSDLSKRSKKHPSGFLSHFQYYFPLAGPPFKMAIDSDVSGKSVPEREIDPPGWPEIAKAVGCDSHEDTANLESRQLCTLAAVDPPPGP